MSFKIVLFAAAVFAYEANAQLPGIVRPFATGFANGFNQMAKPIGQFGQSVMSPVGDYIPRVPQSMPQMMPFPGQYAPKPQAAYDRFDSFGSGMPGASYFPGFLRPQTQFYPIQNQYVKPPRPYPVPSNPIREQIEKYRPSSLLIQPAPEVPTPQGPNTLDAQFEGPKPEVQVEVPKPEGPSTLDAEFDLPNMQRPLPIEDDQQ